MFFALILMGLVEVPFTEIWIATSLKIPSSRITISPGFAVESAFCNSLADLTSVVTCAIVPGDQNKNARKTKSIVNEGINGIVFFIFDCLNLNLFYQY